MSKDGQQLHECKKGSVVDHWVKIGLSRAFKKINVNTFNNALKKRLLDYLNWNLWVYNNIAKRIDTLGYWGMTHEDDLAKTWLLVKKRVILVENLN